MIRTCFVDSFTTEPFKGNPAGVCILDKALSNESMQAIAKEIGFSETAFVQSLKSSVDYSIRYFSPKMEIPLCGHATLAAAKILFENEALTSIRFITGEKVELAIGRKDEFIVMEFPVYETTSLERPPAVLAALGIASVVTCSYSEKNKIILLEIEDAGVLAALRPDFAALLSSYQGINGVLVTAPADSEEYDYHYRYFWPWAGTNEDPVTGGIQTFLARYWSLRLHKTRMKAFQSSERTGFMEVELVKDKVLIYGKAVKVLEGIWSGTL